MKKKYIYLCASVFVVSILIVFYIFKDKSNQSLLFSIPTNQYESVIEIWHDKFQDVGQGVYYQINNSGEIRVPKNYLLTLEVGRIVTSSDFIIYSSPDSNLVGLAYIEQPNTLLMIHDYGTGGNWPKAGYSERFDSTRKRGENLLAKLSKELNVPNLNIDR